MNLSHKSDSRTRHRSYEPSCGYFEGFYFKHTNANQTIAFIPSIHIAPSDTLDATAKTRQKLSASLQIITHDNSWQLFFDSCCMEIRQHRFCIRIGGCIFTPYGCRIHIDTENLRIDGRLVYGPLSRPAYDIMGPLCRFPGKMECSHTIISLLHTVSGSLTVNGIPYTFQNGAGYIEGDRGCSFPDKYLWTQYNNRTSSIVISAASIPMKHFSFTGCFAVILHKGREYRMASYLGAKVMYMDEKRLVIRQRKMILSAELLEKEMHPQPLLAPAFGSMKRWIHENAACKVRYQLWQGSVLIGDIVVERGSFESSSPK